jgi:hypothetical protein
MLKMGLDFRPLFWLAVLGVIAIPFLIWELSKLACWILGHFAFIA